MKKSQKIKKTNSFKMSGKQVKLFAFLAISAIVAFLLTLSPVSEKVEEATGFSGVQGVASDVLYILVALLLIKIAVLMAPIPWLAVVVGLVALAFVVPVIYKYFIQSNDVE